MPAFPFCRQNWELSPRDPSMNPAQILDGRCTILVFAKRKSIRPYFVSCPEAGYARTSNTRNNGAPRRTSFSSVRRSRATHRETYFPAERSQVPEPEVWAQKTVQETSIAPIGYHFSRSLFRGSAAGAEAFTGCGHCSEIRSSYGDENQRHCRRDRSLAGRKQEGLARTGHQKWRRQDSYLRVPATI